MSALPRVHAHRPSAGVGICVCRVIQYTKSRPRAARAGMCRGCGLWHGGTTASNEKFLPGLRGATKVSNTWRTCEYHPLCVFSEPTFVQSSFSTRRKADHGATLSTLSPSRKVSQRCQRRRRLFYYAKNLQICCSSTMNEGAGKMGSLVFRRPNGAILFGGPPTMSAPSSR